MSRAFFTRLAGAILVMSLGQPTESTAGAIPARQTRYPEPPRSDTFDDYHGARVADPYRPLEDPGLGRHARLGRGREPDHSSVSSMAIPGREAIRERLTELWDYEKFGSRRQEGGRYFYFRNSGPPEPERALHDRGARRRAQGPARPEHALDRRHRGAWPAHR